MPAITNLGEHGIIKDILPYNLPPNAFSGGQNVRPYENAIEKFGGELDAFGDVTIPNVEVAPYWLTSLIQGDEAFVVYAGNKHIYGTEGTTHYQLTRASGTYSMAELDGWTGGVMGGVVFLNNGVDAPQQWVSPASLSTKMTDLSNWPASATCK